MDRESLQGWIEDGMSLEEIGRMVDRDPSTIGYWCKKFGLEPNGRAKHAARGGLNKEELEPLVEAGLTLREISAQAGRSIPTVRYWITTHGLERRQSVRRREIEEALRAGQNTIIRRCRRHGATEYALVGTEKRPRCKRCRAEAVARRRRKVKAELVREHGGSCILCGYDRCLDALQFHHVDPATKQFGIAHRGFTRGIAAMRAEAEKCVLPCSNCHAEVEAGAASLS